MNEKWQRNHGTTARIKHVSVPKGCLYKRQACKAWVVREYWGNLANEDWGRGSTPYTDGIAISLWAGALGCHFKAFPTINQRLSSPPATTLLAVPLTTPPKHKHNGAIITVVTLHLGQTEHLYLGIYVTHWQPINLPATSENKGKGVGGGSLVYASKHFHYVGVYVLGWGDGKNLSQVASHRLCIQPLFFFLFFLFFFFVMKTPARGCSLPAPPQKKPKNKKRHIPGLIWLSPGIPRQEAQCLPRSSPTGKLQPLSWVSATKLED